MSSLILGTYPILNSKISSIDENGIETLSYAYTVKTEDAIYYTPEKDAEFYGLVDANNPIDSEKPTDFPVTSSSYLVTQVSADQLSGGLTKLNINTVGTRNIDTPARVSLLPNYPLIYGLSGTSELFGDNYAILQYKAGTLARIQRGGVGVVVTFIDEKGTEQAIYQTYSYAIMPSTLKNSSLPVARRGAFYTESQSGLYYQSLSYAGFICKEITFQTYGAIIIYRLTFAESGKMSWSVASSDGATGSSAVVFDL